MRVNLGCGGPGRLNQQVDEVITDLFDRMVDGSRFEAFRRSRPG